MISLRRLAASTALLAALSSLPAAANHGRLSATRSPGGPILAGTRVSVTATIENVDANLELLDADLNVPLDHLITPYFTLIPGTVTALWREQGSPIPGTIVSGNDPTDTSVAVHLDYLPAGQHADVTFELRAAAHLPAGVNQDTVQIFLTYSDVAGGPAQSTPWYMIIPILAQPHLQLTKSDANAVFTPGGGAVTYSIVPTNDGTQDATGLTLTDTIPPYTHFSPAGSTSGWSCAPNSSSRTVCTLTFDSLAAGQSLDVALRLIFDPAAVPAGLEQLQNVAHVEDDGTNTSGSDTPQAAGATESTPVAAAPDLTLGKSDGGASVRPGNRVSYTLSYANAGTQDATGVHLVETVPANTTFDPAASTAGWSCSPSSGAAGAACTLSIGDLAVGTSASAIFTVRVAAALPAGVDRISNTAQVADDRAGGADLNPADNSATDTTPVIAQPQLDLSKTDHDAFPAPGDLVRYELTYSNMGNQGATGVVLQETVPDHTSFSAGASDPGWSCVPVAGPAGVTCTYTVGSLGVGAAGLVAFAVTLDAPLPAGVEELLNHASVHDDTSAPAVQAQETTPVNAAPDLSLTKSDGGVTATTSDVVVYTLTYRNVGDQGATGVVLEDVVPAHSTFAPASSDASWSCDPVSGAAGASCILDVGDLAAGATGSARFAVRVDATLPAGVEELLNTALVVDDGANGQEPNPIDNSASERTPLEASPVLSLTKSADRSPAVLGEALVYTLAWSNAGNQAAAGVTLEETVPDYASFSAGASDAGWSCSPAAGPAGAGCTLTVGTVPAGGSGSARFAVVIDPTLPAGVDQVANHATVHDDTGTGPDDQADVSTPVDASPALSLTKSADRSPAVPGDPLVYTLAWSNTGDQAAAGVKLEETVPDHTSFSAGASDAGWSCSPAAGPAGATCTLAVGTVLAGGSGSARFAVIVDQALPAGVRQVANHATVQDDTGTGPDDQADVSTPVDASPALSLTKSADRSPATPGEALVYTLAWSNAGNQAASGVALEETVPDHTSFSAGASGAGWSCSPAPGPAGATCTLAVGTVPAGGSGSARFGVTVDPALPAGVDQVANHATVQDDTGTGPDDQADVSTPVDASPGLRLTKSVDRSPAIPGEPLTYTLRWTNAGSQDAGDVLVQETVPAHTRFSASASDPRWACDPADGPAGASCVLTVGALPAGSSASASFTALVEETLPAGVDQVLNAATIRDGAGSGPAGQAELATPLAAAPDLSIVKTDNGVSAHPGEVITYTLTWSNLGTQGTVGVELAEAVPDHTHFAPDASDPAWVCAAALPSGSGAQPADPTSSLKTERIQHGEAGHATTASAMGCTLQVGDLAAGATGTAHFAVLVDDPVDSAVDSVLNVVDILDDGSQGADANPADNSASEETPILHPPSQPPAGAQLDVTLADHLSEDLDDSHTVSAGDVLTYAVRVENLSDHPATELTWALPVPGHTSYVAGSLVGPSVLSVTAGHVIRAQLGDLPAGAVTSLVFDVEVGSLPETLTHLRAQGTIAAVGVDPQPSDDPDTPVPDDPTLTPLGSGGGSAGAPENIPALSELGLVLLSLLLGFIAWRVLR